jgi:hypothetical protein
VPHTRAANSVLISAVLSGAWRQFPPTTNLTAEELSGIAPLLIGSGGGALAFWKIRQSELAQTPAGEELKQAYRLYTLHSAIHEQEIVKVLKLLSRAGLTAILVKGWSMARHFPEPALRPYGDIDLFVRPDHHAVAKEVLEAPEGREVFVDLHSGAGHLDDEPFEDLYARSEEVRVGGEPVRVLSPEDHLRILCVHFLHHGAWRPAALCDIALLVEKYRGDFNWDICLTRNRKRARWIECTVGLAHHLLGAEISDLPIETAAKKLPRWLVPAVMKEWDHPVSVEHIVPPPLADRLAHPVETIRAIRDRWPPNPIQATVVLNGPFNEWPRVIFQAGNYLSRTAKFFAQLPKRRD